MATPDVLFYLGLAALLFIVLWAIAIVITYFIVKYLADMQVQLKKR